MGRAGCESVKRLLLTGADWAGAPLQPGLPNVSTDAIPVAEPVRLYLDAEVHGYGIGIDRDHSRYLRVVKIGVGCGSDCGFARIIKGRPYVIGLRDRRGDFRLTRTGARTRYKRHRYPPKDRSPSHALSMTEASFTAPEHAICVISLQHASAPYRHLGVRLRRWPHPCIRSG